MKQRRSPEWKANFNLCSGGRGFCDIFHIFSSWSTLLKKKVAFGINSGNEMLQMLPKLINFPKYLQFKE
jgi:hypothetical protein